MQPGRTTLGGLSRDSFVLLAAAASKWELAAARVQLEDAPSDVIAAEARRRETFFAAHTAARKRFELDPAGRAAVNTHFNLPSSASASSEW